MAREVQGATAMQTLGAAFAGLVGPGDLIILTGALGAGKTTFVQGLARGLGVDAQVTSPTFVIARSYPLPDLTFVHVDAYRMVSSAELDDLGIDDEMADAVIVVEWGVGVVEHWADGRIELTIERCGSERERSVSYRTVGDSWVERGPALMDLLGEPQSS